MKAAMTRQREMWLFVLFFLLQQDEEGMRDERGSYLLRQNIERPFYRVILTDANEDTDAFIRRRADGAAIGENTPT